MVVMTRWQKDFNNIDSLPEDKLNIVIQFAESLCSDTKSQTQSELDDIANMKNNNK